MSVFEFPFSDFVFITPFLFGAFGFLKKAFKKVKNVVGGALSFIPGGSVIKQGLGIAKFGIGAIVREVRGKKPTQPTTRQPSFASSSLSPSFSTFGQPQILGIPRNVAFGLAGVLIVGFIFFTTQRKR